MKNFPPTQEPLHLMKIIPRRILSELLLTFLVLQFILSFAMVLVGLIQGFHQGLPLTYIPRIIFYVLPFSQSLATPFSILFTSVIVYARMNVSREIIALQSSGISSLRIILPCLILGLLASFYTLYMGDMGTSWGAAQTQRVFLSASQDILYNKLKADKMITFDRDNLKFTVSAVDGKILRDAIITRTGSEGTGTFLVTAREAIIEVDSQEKLLDTKSEQQNVFGSLYSRDEYKDGVLKITFYGVQSTSQDVTARIHQKQVAMIPLSDIPSFLTGSGGSKSPSRIAIADLPALVQEQRDRIRRIQDEMRLAVAEELIFGDFGQLGSERWRNAHNAIHASEHTISRAKLEPYRRWTMGFSCLCFALFGAPLAVWKGRHGALQLIATALVPIMCIYYPLVMFVTKLGKAATLAPLGMWVPNLFLFILGLYLLRRAV